MPRYRDRVAVVFDDPGLVANAGLIPVDTLAGRLGVEELVDRVVRLGRAGGFAPGRKVSSKDLDSANPGRSVRSESRERPWGGRRHQGVRVTPSTSAIMEATWGGPQPVT